MIGTGGCSAYDVVHILEKGREAVEDCVVEMDADRAETDPKVFTRIHMHFVVKGRGAGRGQGKRAIDLSIEKYCSATAMLSKTATVTHDYEVVDSSTRNARSASRSFDTLAADGDFFLFNAGAANRNSE